MCVAFVFLAFANTKTKEDHAPTSSRKCNGKEKKPGREENSKMPTSPTTLSNKASFFLNSDFFCLEIALSLVCHIFGTQKTSDRAI